MKNAAGDKECDEYIPQELEKAGIAPHLMSFPISAKGEVPTKCVGFLNGWTFKRAWYYWIATAGPGIALPFNLAETLHAEYGQEVRVGGNCTCPSPREQYGKPWHLGVPLYHVDSQEGLVALADAIRITAVEGGQE